MTRLEATLVGLAVCVLAAGCPDGGTEDRSPPTTPTGLWAVPTTASSIQLQWQSSTDDVGVAGYDVYRDGTRVASVPTTATEVTDRDLLRSTTYCYAVSAFDAAGNASARSIEACETTLPFTIRPVDATAGVGYACSIAADAIGRVHIAYYDVPNGRLKYATDASGSWSMTTLSPVASRGSGGTAIATDPNGFVHIAFQADGSVKYATNVSGAWETSTIASGEHFAALVLDSAGKPHIGYLSSGGPYVGSNGSGAWASVAVEPGTCCGPVALALDVEDKVHVAYFRGWDGRLRYATDTSGAFVASEVDAGGTAVSIAVDHERVAHVAYYSSAHLRYGTNAAGTWATADVQNLGVSGYWLSLALDATGRAHVTTAAGTGGVYYSTNASGTWLTTAIDPGARQAYAGNAIAVDSSGDVHVCYADPEGLVYAVTK